MEIKQFVSTGSEYANSVAGESIPERYLSRSVEDLANCYSRALHSSKRKNSSFCPKNFVVPSLKF